MYVEQIEGMHYLNILKEPIREKDGSYNKRHAKEIREKLLVDNKNILIVGPPGMGKSTFMADIIYTFKKKVHYKITYLTGKEGKPFDDAMAVHSASEYYHLRILERQEDQPEGDLYRFMSPITLFEDPEKELPGLPKKKLPPLTFYSFPLSVSNNALRTLFYNPNDETISSMLRSLRKKITPNMGIADFKWETYKAIPESDKVELYADETTGWLPEEIEGTKATRASIVNGLRLFNRHPFLKRHNHPFTLHVEKMLKEKNVTDMYIGEWIDQDLYYFNLICLLDKYEEVINNAKKGRFLFALPELESIVPANDKTKAQKLFAQRLKKFLNISRSKAVTIIANTQSLGNLDELVLSKFNVKMLMGATDDDRAKLQKKHAEFSSAHIRKLAGIERGEYMLWIGKQLRVLSAYMPPHRILEEGEDFVDEYAKKFPHLMKDYRQQVKEFEDELEEENQKSKQNYLEYKQMIKDSKVSKSELRKEKELQKTKQELSFVQQKVKENQGLALQELKKQCYELKKNGIKNPDRTLDKDPSWRAIGVAVHLNHVTAKKYALEYAQQAQDLSFGITNHNA